MNRTLLRTAAVTPWLLAALTAGCGSDGVTPPSAQSTGEKAPLNKPSAAVASKGAAPAMQMAAPEAIIPDGAKYTIVCGRFAGLAHVAESQNMKDRLVAATSRSDFYLLHEQDHSTLYFGYYKAIDKNIDSVEAGRCEKDMGFVKSLTDSSGHRLFTKCLAEPLAVPDPDGPPEYDLAKLDKDKALDDPTRRYWSVAIAAYTVDANPQGLDAGKSRKQLAVESVIEARKQGIEAYYYNGENVSTVCIGAWPRSAVAEQDAKSVGQDVNTDPSQELLVSPSPLPKSVTDQLQSSGKNLKIFQPKVDISNASMVNTLKAYPVYSVNGEDQVNRYTDPRTGQQKLQPQHSFLVEIPRLQPSMLSAAPTESKDDNAPPTVINPLGPGSGGGQLRSLQK